ncbi:hypothetical protein TNIN_386571 [Trichonephila inaurata madagascariensis]|uniref:Uncharacterized protein n=1 Tax=Trichonephila inaurata madagascariensis TaxID=2747483 RepID=A0A8X6WNN8_9ARAC|nr:hypothetical protein TNIN_386571 [Trichonephila inaurata madagascariensis]
MVQSNDSTKCEGSNNGDIFPSFDSRRRGGPKMNRRKLTNRGNRFSPFEEGQTARAIVTVRVLLVTTAIHQKVVLLLKRVTLLFWKTLSRTRFLALSQDRQIFLAPFFFSRVCLCSSSLLWSGWTLSFNGHQLQ